HTRFEVELDQADETVLVDASLVVEWSDEDGNDALERWRRHDLPTVPAASIDMEHFLDRLLPRCAVGVVVHVRLHRFPPASGPRQASKIDYPHRSPNARHLSLALASPTRNRSRRSSWLDYVVVDVVPDDAVAESGPLRQIDVAVGVKLVAGRAEIGVGRVVIDARRQQAFLVVLAGILRGGAADLQIAPARHVDLTAQPVGLA